MIHMNTTTGHKVTDEILTCFPGHETLNHESANKTRTHRKHTHFGLMTRIRTMSAI